jgi:hypothetical protein
VKHSDAAIQKCLINQCTGLQHFARNERKHEYFSVFLGNCHIALSDDTYKRQEDCMNSVKQEQGQAPDFQTASETVLVPMGLVDSIRIP